MQGCSSGKVGHKAAVVPAAWEVAVAAATAAVKGAPDSSMHEPVAGPQTTSDTVMRMRNELIETTNCMVIYDEQSGLCRLLGRT